MEEQEHRSAIEHYSTPFVLAINQIDGWLSIKTLEGELIEVRWTSNGWVLQDVGTDVDRIHQSPGQSPGQTWPTFESLMMNRSFRFRQAFFQRVNEQLLRS
ncbi:uncharacterized protein CYBJADRAFT_166380 [Cyberlindnera jadinii NRRL Y-1542]|uniref:GSKIP domain-containing protein n=1 Tax=Cyberlindnera jadinii (strain ATCC 18201 / CBS 1600 / BCRC 20928 / JCM 3617 / NBRC 0987 / NRRL Y-1542) TaxID=983966 RepID=A0A1E4RTP3_CYBJN|nr:hypothetical protein CYBJADRAFT_170107 [Cyberlindnera jadinii NRRL Y-1542]XP_020072723.1 hypothetical protein CYBJADRAFT_166380 [Cyberlindnera jadinii NRRL Y-1542]ODV70630.1 hypothetical protein CYBJADRAFT_170107 [Cyberlindnera jadinii NRRL Y-1542]ODV75684.1 hypothetical protein CYBJADRAFT_166380 [Cyberlindnera jadinii NRRL Y-1542]